MPAEPVVVHTSLRGWAGAILTPLLLIGLGGFGVARSDGRAVLAIVLVGLGAALGAGVLLDYPRHARFGAGGIVRVCPLRTHRLAWADVATIERTPRTLTSRLLLGRDGRRDAGNHGPQQARGGLVAGGHGRGRWLLTDRVESADEHDRLHELILHLGATTVMRAARPAEKAPPSDLYRRSRSVSPGRTSRSTNRSPGPSAK